MLTHIILADYIYIKIYYGTFFYLSLCIIYILIPTFISMT